MNRKLLDCTLRDGGYRNEWRFGLVHIEGIVTLLAQAGLDIIEVGFLNAQVSYDPECSIFPDMASLNKTFERIDKRNVQILAMIEFGTCGIEQILPAEESFADGIRVMFRKQERKEAVDFCGALKAKGYRALAQPVSLTEYREEEACDLAELANRAGLDGVYLVDTYGLLHKGLLMRYFELLDQLLDPRIAIGYHGHNNLQMGHANSMGILERQSARELLADGSLLGMGKSAGNAPTELNALYASESLGHPCDIGPILNAVEEHLLPFYTEPSWGYQVMFFLSAAAHCHPRYVAYYRKEKNMSYQQIYQILQQFEEGKRLHYDRLYAETFI